MCCENMICTKYFSKTCTIKSYEYILYKCDINYIN